MSVFLKHTFLPSILIYPFLFSKKVKLIKFFNLYCKNYSINVKDTTIVARTNNYKRIQEEIPFLWLLL